jgi:hypothetical protein
MHFLP